MSKFTFIYKDIDGKKIKHTFEETGATAIVRNFVYFLQGTSFGRPTVKEALDNISADITDSMEYEKSQSDSN